MSDEFIQVATKEISEDISELEKIISSCTSDADIILHASKFQKHTHKIKGLAPMMGKENLGTISSSLDAIFKTLLQKSEIDGVFKILSVVIPSIRSVLVEPEFNIQEIQNQISQIEEITN